MSLVGGRRQRSNKSQQMIWFSTFPSLPCSWCWCVWFLLGSLRTLQMLLSCFSAHDYGVCMFSSLMERALACCWFVPRWMLVSSVSRSCAELLNSVCDSVVIYRFYSNEQFLLQETCVVVASRNLNLFEDGGVVYFPGLSHSELVKNYNSVFFSF